MIISSHKIEMNRLLKKSTTFSDRKMRHSCAFFGIGEARMEKNHCCTKFNRGSRRGFVVEMWVTGMPNLEFLRDTAKG